MWKRDLINKLHNCEKVKIAMTNEETLTVQFNQSQVVLLPPTENIDDNIIDSYSSLIIPQGNKSHVVVFDHIVYFSYDTPPNDVRI